MQKCKELFPNYNIIPKQHYLLHLPSTIEKYGPLVHVWSMRFENKHQFLKQKMTGSKNFKNIEKSVANHFARYECALNACEKHPLFHNDLVVGKSTNISNLAETKQRINAFFGTEIDCIKHVHTVFPGLFFMDRNLFLKNVRLLLVKVMVYQNLEVCSMYGLSALWMKIYLHNGFSLDYKCMKL